MFVVVYGNRIHKNGVDGCPRTAASCHFIHPSDPEWHNVPHSPTLLDNWRSLGESPPRRSSPPSSASYEYDRGQSISADRQRRASGSSPRRRRLSPRGSGTYHHGRSPPRSPRRDDSPPRRRSSSNIPRDDRQLDPAPKSVFKPPMRPGDRPSEKEKMPLPASSQKGTAVPVPMSSAAAASAAPKPAPETSSSTPSGSGRPSSRSFSEVLPPPPSINPLPPTDEMTPEQRRGVWEKRIALMADATQEYIDLGKLEKDVESRRRQVQSAAFNSLSPEMKNAFEAGLKSAEAAYERKKVSLNGAISKLSETDFWPAIPSSQKVGDMEAKLKEAKTMLGSLADSVIQLYKRIEGLHGQRPGAPRPSPSSADESAATTGGGDGESRARKRRRVSSVDGGDNGDATATPPEVRQDVESIKDTIREIEDRLQDVENDATQHSRDIIEQLEAKMDEKIEEIARSADVATLVETQLGPQTAQTLQAYNEGFAQADQEIAELAREMADLIPRLDELQRENDLFKQEDAADKELLAQLVKADQDNAEAIARLQEEARTLRGALTVRTKRALPLPSPSPFSGPFMEAIKGSIATQVQEQVLPILVEVRGEMERVAKTRDAELYEKLRDKLEQSSKVSQLISTWIERNPDDAHHVLAAAVAKANVDGASGSDSALT